MAVPRLLGFAAPMATEHLVYLLLTKDKLCALVKCLIVCLYLIPHTNNTPYPKCCSHVQHKDMQTTLLA
jgi:hypothetical protein